MTRTDTSRLALGAAGVLLAAVLPGATIQVTNTNVSGPGSLEQAILDANASVGVADVIVFAIPGPGIHTIAPKTPLPLITDTVTIDGYTQPGASPNTQAVGSNAVILIEVDGFQAGTVTALFDVHADNVVIRGLSVVNAQGGDGIAFSSGTSGKAIGNFVGVHADGLSSAGNGCAGIRSATDNTTVGTAAPADRNVIAATGGCGINLIFQTTGGIAQNNYIGTNPAGTVGFGGSIGVDLTGSGHRLGGSGPGEGNLISGNNGDAVRIRAGATGMIVQGNLIGTDVSGTAKLANNAHGVLIGDSSSNTVGGSTAGARNVISGNAFGIEVIGSSSGNVITGNFVGTNASGTAAIGNTAFGIVTAGTNTRIGGSAAGEGNVISGNGGEGIASLNALGLNVLGNRIGTDVTGAAALPNGANGILLAAGGSGTIGDVTPGSGNRIAFNDLSGVRVLAGTFLIQGNSIHSNGQLGIDLNGDGVTPNDVGDADSGPNALQNYPALTSAAVSAASIRIQGTLDSHASAPYLLDFFSSSTCDGSGYGEGQVYLGSGIAHTDAGGHAALDVTLAAHVTIGDVITATATSVVEGTSEFSPCAPATPAALAYYTLPPCRVVDTRDPNGPLGGPALAANAERTFVVRGTCGVPSSALAVSLNVAVTLESAGGDLRIFPAGTLLPLVSAINYDAFKTRSNNAVIGLGAAGDVTVHVDQPAGTVHLILDVNGYFQ